jgi:hypothetical protein
VDGDSSALHRVAVVRVEIINPATGGLVIDFLEVSRSGESDRVLGRAFDPIAAAQLLGAWLQEVAGRAGGGAVTFARRARDLPPATVDGDIAKETS